MTDRCRSTGVLATERTRLRYGARMPKRPPKETVTETKPRALGEDDHFGEQTFARALKAVTAAIEEPEELRSKAIQQIVEGFHAALDGGLPGESLPAPVLKKFRAWVEENHPDVFENAEPASLEGYLIDENEGVGPIVEFFKTVPSKDLRAIFKSFQKRINSFYSNSRLNPQDEQHKAAIDTLERIEKFGLAT